MSTSNEQVSNSVKKSKRSNGEGSVYWDKSRKMYAASIHDINGKRQRAFFKTEDEAHEWRSAQKAARAKGEGTYVRDPKSTLGEYLMDWIGSKKRLSYNGKRAYEQAIIHRINPYIGRVSLAKTNAKIIEGLLNQLLEKYSQGTVRGVIRTLNKAFNDGVRLGDMPYNPLEKVEIPPLKSNPSQCIPKRDVEKLKEEAKKNPSDHARLIIGICLGLRPGEVAGLKWSDFHEETMSLSILRQVQRVKGLGLLECPPKTMRKKPIPLTAFQVQLLKEHRKSLTKTRKRLVAEEDYIFTNSAYKPMDHNCDRKWFRQLCERADVKRYEMYQMRKTAFTELSSVTDLATVMAYSGHTQVQTLLNHYLTPEDEAIRRALDLRERLG